LELLMEDESGQPVKLPQPRLFHYPGADVVDVPENVIGEIKTKQTQKRARQTA
jgi:hypothetical protein